MIAPARVRVSDVEPGRPTAIIVTTLDGVQYVGGRKKSQMVITMTPHGFLLSY